jgi:hypothetical protein
MKAREDASAGTKKRRAVPNPNKKPMTIHDILSKKSFLKTWKNV